MTNVSIILNVYIIKLSSCYTREYTIMLTLNNESDNKMPDLTTHATEATAGIAAKTSIGAGITATIFGGVGLQDWLMIIGILTTLGTFTINWFYQHKKHQLAVDRLKHSHKRSEDLDDINYHEHRRDKADFDSKKP